MKTTLLGAMLALVPVLVVAQQPSASTQTKTKVNAAAEVGPAKANVDVQASARLDAAKAALVRAGRAQPDQQDVTLAAKAMERGATDAQIEALAKHAPADRSLAVSFNVLTTLAVRGVPLDSAVASVASKLDANASDEVIASLAGSVKPAGANPPAKPDADAGVNAAAGASAAVGGLTKATAGAAGSVTGSVLPKKP